MFQEASAAMSRREYSEQLVGRQSRHWSGVEEPGYSNGSYEARGRSAIFVPSEEGGFGLGQQPTKLVEVTGLFATFPALKMATPTPPSRPWRRLRHLLSDRSTNCFTKGRSHRNCPSENRRMTLHGHPKRPVCFSISPCESFFFTHAADAVAKNHAADYCTKS